jgi:acyl-CoA thioester hydrolase
MTDRVTIEVATHYYQFDQQGVAFNMWYLAFVEQARNSYLVERGFSLEDLLASGHDVQLVHIEVDWKAPLRYGDHLEVDVTLGHTGSTSFSVNFSLMAGGHECATASVVYVIIDARTHAKAPLPIRLRTALEEGRTAQ